jgi:hypothetical protein
MSRLFLALDNEKLLLVQIDLEGNERKKWKKLSLQEFVLKEHNSSM